MGQPLICSSACWLHCVKVCLPDRPAASVDIGIQVAPAKEAASEACLSVQVMNRAVLAGQLLAHVLMSGAHGGRPVTLIGFSMGARYLSVFLPALHLCCRPGLVKMTVT